MTGQTQFPLACIIIRHHKIKKKKNLAVDRWWTFWFDRGIHLHRTGVCVCVCLQVNLDRRKRERHPDDGEGMRGIWMYMMYTPLIPVDPISSRWRWAGRREKWVQLMIPSSGLHHESITGHISGYVLLSIHLFPPLFTLVHSIDSVDTVSNQQFFFFFFFSFLHSTHFKAFHTMVFRCIILSVSSWSSVRVLAYQYQ